MATTTTRAGIVPVVVRTLQWPSSRSIRVASTSNRGASRWCAAYCSRYCTNWSRATQRPNREESGSPEGATASDLQNVPTSLLFAGGLANNGGPTQTIALRDATDNPALAG